MQQRDPNNFNDTLTPCEVSDVINELDEHMNSVSALVYIGHYVNLGELDTGIYSGLLNSINIINTSSGHLLQQIKEYFHEV